MQPLWTEFSLTALGDVAAAVIGSLLWIVWTVFGGSRL